MATITKDIIALAKKIDSAQEWDMDDCKALCEALDMGDEWEAADGDTFESVIEKAVETALKADEKKEITVEDVMDALRENVSTEWEEDWGIQYVDYYLHLEDLGYTIIDLCGLGEGSFKCRTSVESYVEDLICDVEMPAASRDDDDDYDDDDDDYNDYDDDDYDDDDDDDYGDCTEGWEIKLCVRYGVTAYRDLDWSVIVAEIEEREDGIFYDIASDLAAQANAWLKEVDD